MYLLTPLTEIYEEVLPLDDMATGMGERLVQTALQSPVIRERNGACAVLERWIVLLNQSLQAVSPDLFSVLKDIVAIEVNSDTQKNMENILMD